MQPGRGEFGLGTSALLLCSLWMMWFGCLHQTMILSTHWGGLQQNLNESQTQICAGKQWTAPLGLGVSLLPQVKEFKYLGLFFAI